MDDASNNSFLGDEMNDLNFEDLIRLAKTIKDKQAPNQKETVILLSIIQEILDLIRPNVKRPLLVIALAGMVKILEETKEHFENMEE